MLVMIVTRQQAIVLKRVNHILTTNVLVKMAIFQIPVSFVSIIVQKELIHAMKIQQHALLLQELEDILNVFVKMVQIE